MENTKVPRRKKAVQPPVNEILIEGPFGLIKEGSSGALAQFRANAL
jgi:hypothetical protein